MWTGHGTHGSVIMKWLTWHVWLVSYLAEAINPFHAHWKLYDSLGELLSFPYSSSPWSIPSPRGSLGDHTWFHNQFPPFFSVLHCPLGICELQACPFHDVVFPPLLMFALSSSPIRCALQDGFGQTWWMGDMSIPLQFASHYDGQDVFVWSDCLLDLGTDFFVGNMVFV